MASQAAIYYSGGQSNPADCVRAPVGEWYISQSDCLDGIGEGFQCNPRYINGVWSRYMPYARDSAACDGNLPPDILPQILDSTALIDTEVADYTEKPTLRLNMDGNIGQLQFRTNAGSVNIVWKQSDNVVAQLFNPVEYYYAVAFGPGVARLTINTMNGHATATFPFAGYLAKIQFQITNILPWQDTNPSSTDLSVSERTGKVARFSRKSAAHMQALSTHQLG